ncbi:MAG: NAD(P)/FAD-dependent oxidoreductase [Sphingobacteriales bacterium]|nr:NAD(P)/FAD-dependent oxidoreductase [Sphingobacteriales bacterium]
MNTIEEIKAAVSLLPLQGAGGYDLSVVGGGLAGLSLSIQAAKAGYSVILFEKEKYPFHKVCGEYISFESRDFLEDLGVPLSEMNLPEIKKLIVTAPNGKMIQSGLGLGGFGISRYTLDNQLADIAKNSGVTILEETKVNDIVFQNDQFTINTDKGEFSSKVCAGTFGKRSNIDIKWNRDFIQNKPNKLNNYIGIKYHIQINRPADTIALHNFSDGYCGISQIEENKYCLCYLTTASNLRICGNNISVLEKNILSQNIHLKKIFSSATILYPSPLTISQISFDNKTQIENHVLLIGDAAGMITPLCGNGMSMALHGSKIAFHCIDKFLSGQFSRGEMEEQYQCQWKKQFRSRLKAGRVIQRFFGKKWMTNLFIASLKPFPSLVKWLIRQTHGDPF